MLLKVAGKSFLPTVLSCCRFPKSICLDSRQVRFMGHSAEDLAEALRQKGVRSAQPKASSTPFPLMTFEDLGLHSPMVTSLCTAFPSVKYPTKVQEKFIPAILSGKDVILKDETGSGKSFGLVVALLNKACISSHVMTRSQKLVCKRISSLVLVPHRDLAYQLYHWIQGIVSVAAPPLDISDVAQVLVRDGATHLTDGLHTLQRTPPHILIGTPQAIMDIYRACPQALQLSHLSSVVVDEVDYLVETVPKKDPSKSYHKAADKAIRKLLAHPGVTRQLLDIIFARRIQINNLRKDEPGAIQHQRKAVQTESSTSLGLPQLILSSATLRRHLSNYLFEESGWLNRDSLLKVKGTGRSPVGYDQKSSSELYPLDGLGGSGILHSVLVVSEDGIANIAKAVRSPTPASDDLQPINPQAIFSPTAETEAVRIDAALVAKYADTPTPFNPNAMEAIATSFALDVPSVALLVLPSSSPVQRGVHELREMGVNAHRLDMLAEENGRSHLLRGAGGVQENPTLLVSTLATTRGLDMPELTHVFILGIPNGGKVTGKTVDGYVHLAGRVGRFGRGGKVITVVEEEEAAKMANILARLNEQPVQFEHFD